MPSPTRSLSFIDVEIRIFKREDRYFPVELTINGQQEFRGTMSDAITTWLPSGDPAEDGKALFDFLVGDKALGNAWAEARGQSQHRRVRLRLDVDTPALHHLPWELLHESDSVNHAFLAAQADTPFSRYLAVETPWGGAVETRPIRVLAVISSPEDLDELYNLSPLDVASERAILEEAFSILDARDIHLDILDTPVTLARITDALQHGYHILHYTGHGAFNSRRGQAALYLQDEVGDTEVTRDTAFVKMLAGLATELRPRLIFLSACQTATRSTTDALLGLGPKLVSAGIPAVVAMQDAISAKTASQLNLAFYRRLAEHGNVDSAMNEARSVLLAAARSDAAVPVLFMRLTSGKLWEKQDKAPSHLALPDLRISPPPEPVPLPEIQNFVGRNAELATCMERLATSHLVAITGMPGVGKSALAVRLAQSAAPSASIFWHQFYSHEGIESLIWKLAGFLYHHGQSEVWETLENTRLSGGKLPPNRELLDYIAQQLCLPGGLLCLDTVQWLSKEDADLLAHFVQRLSKKSAVDTNARECVCAHADACVCPDVCIHTVLVSQVVPDFVPRGDVVTLEGLGLDETRDFLASRELVFAEPLFEEIYTRTEGNPQLLLLSANVLRYASNPEKVLTRLAIVDNVEAYLLREVDAGLSEEDREVMIATAILLGYPGTRDAIETVSDRRRTKRLLRRLRSQNLLRLEDDEDVEAYSEHATLRDYYYDVPSRRERREMHRRAAAHYDETSHVLKAAMHYVQAGVYTRAVALVTEDVLGLINQGYAKPVHQLLAQFEARHLDDVAWARVNVARGEVCSVLGARECTEAGYQTAWETLGVLADSDVVRVLQAEVCRGMGDVLRNTDPKEALQWIDQGLEILGEDAPEARATLLLKKSTVQMHAGDNALAIETVERGLALLPVGRHWLRLGAFNNLGAIYWKLGDFEQAIQVTRDGLSICRDVRATFLMLSLLNNLGNYTLYAGDWTAAREAYDEALAVAAQLGAAFYQVAASLNLGLLYIKQGEYEQARAHLDQSMEWAAVHGYERAKMYIHSNLADLCVRQRQLDAAETHLAEAERLAVQMESQDELANIYSTWSHWYLLHRDVTQALAYAEKAIDLARALSMPVEEGIALRALGDAYLENARPADALDAFARSLALLDDKDPYEAARTRLHWGVALGTAEDGDERAGLLDTARVTFLRLGAKQDLAAVEAAIRDVCGSSSSK